VARSANFPSLPASQGSLFARPCDSEKKRAVLERLDVMSHAFIQREEPADAQIERPLERS
jgi:hypothetical protein